MAIKHVKEFGFPKDFGFTGSLGQRSIRPHMRGPAQPATLPPPMPAASGPPMRRPLPGGAAMAKGGKAKRDC